jgi:hypothetical protein
VSGNTSIVCTECGAKNPVSYAYCFSCGSTLPNLAKTTSAEAAEPGRAQVVCPKCRTAILAEYQYCPQCGTHLRPRGESKKAFGIPLALGAIGGLVAAVYSYTHGALPIRVAFSAVFGFGFWWTIIACIAWLVRPSCHRAAAVAAAVLLVVIVGVAYIFTQAWTGQDLKYIEMPTSRSLSAEATAITETAPVPTSTPHAFNPLRRSWSAPFGWPPTSTPVSSACLPWQLTKSYVGQYQCICGNVHHTQTSGGTFFIHFADDNQAFYGFSRDYYWEQGTLEGKCVRICGTVQTNLGRPRILIDDPDEQVFWCR